MALNRGALLKAAPELPTEIVACPEFGGDLIVRGMTGKENTAFLRAVGRKSGKPGEIEVDEDRFAALLLVHCLVDEKGKRLLKDDEADVVLGWPSAPYNRLAAVAMRLNGMMATAGNSAATDGGASSTG